MKRILSFILVLCMTLSLCACGTSSLFEDSSGESGLPAGEELRVAVISEYSDIINQVFDQAIIDSCEDYCDDNHVEMNIYSPGEESAAGRMESVDTAVADGYNVIVMNGAVSTGSLVESAEKYPDIKFIGLGITDWDLLAETLGEKFDYTPGNWVPTDYYRSENVYIASYQEQVSGYLAGYAAAKMGYKKLGFLGAVESPLIARYGYGFVQGVNDASPPDSGVEVNYVYANQLNDDDDITDYMNGWYESGTKVVFSCGGTVYTSAAKAAEHADGMMIGAVSDQAKAIDKKYGEGRTFTSAVTDYGMVITNILSSIEDGAWLDYAGRIDSFGIVSSDKPEQNCVRLPSDSTLWTKDFSEDDYRDLLSRILNGEIQVANDLSAESPSGENITVNYLGNIK